MTDFYTVGYTKTSNGVVAPIEVLVSGSGDTAGKIFKASATTPISLYEESALERKLTFTLNAHPVTMVDSGANGGHGSVRLYTFPAGLTRSFGSKVRLTITAGTGITATADVVCGMGVTATAAANATLETTEVTFLPSTACSLVGSTKTFTASSSAISAFVDGRATPVPVFLNFAVDTTGISADAVLTVTGVVTMSAFVI